jgi:hypothetical protein
MRFKTMAIPKMRVKPMIWPIQPAAFADDSHVALSWNHAGTPRWLHFHAAQPPDRE